MAMLSSTQEKADVMRSYQRGQRGVSAHAVKPVDFSQLISVVNELRRYWMEINELPPAQSDENIPSRARLPAAP